ncbi:MAG TPA: DUF6364 family protein [Thermoanaerobaculia bacterium]|nr:DUF6364 family protein [Thermoanaerobaculia bacterium]
MRTKLTVTIDEDLLPRAKRFAKQRGTSLSRVIEEALRAATEDHGDFVDKWRGRFTLSDSADPRFRYLEEKYGADSD